MQGPGPGGQRCGKCTLLYAPSERLYQPDRRFAGGPAGPGGRERQGVAIQMVSTGFSALIGLLLSYSGSVGTLSLLVVLMYQAAWSALGMVAARHETA